jgi:Protein of unknown function (DUF3179)
MAAAPTRRWLVLVAIAAAIAAAIALPIAVAIPYVQSLFPEPPEQFDDAPAPAIQSNRPFWNSPFIMPGIDRPPVVPGYEAALDGDEEVIGVDIHGKHRAYRVAALRRMPHVANDLVGRTPVTATYCPNSDVAQTFSSHQLDKPLPMSLGGWAQGSMIMRYKDVFFEQKSGRRHDTELQEELPFATIPHQRTTWRKWRSSRPDTDVCVSFDR